MTAPAPTPVADDPADDEGRPLRRLRLYAQRDDGGDVRGTYLLCDGERLALWSDPATGQEAEPAVALPAAALPAIFRRYGRPLEEGLAASTLGLGDAPEDAPDAHDEPLAIPGGPARLRRFRFLPYGWVHPADYLLWEAPGEEPLAAPAPLVASALAAVARAASR